MRKSLVLIVFSYLLLTLTTCSENDTTPSPTPEPAPSPIPTVEIPTPGFKALTRSSKENKLDDMLVRVFYPKGMEEGKKYPLILFLHGAGETKKTISHTLHLGKLISSESVQAHTPVIGVFPNHPGSRSEAAPLWYGEPLVMIYDLLQELIESGWVDASRCYITGLSMGGYGTYDALHKWPTFFAAAAPICGAPGDFTKKMKSWANKTPIWIFHGDQDNVVPVENTENVVAYLREDGGTVDEVPAGTLKLSTNSRVTIYPGVGHSSESYAYGEPKFLEWLLQFSR